MYTRTQIREMVNFIKGTEFYAKYADGEREIKEYDNQRIISIPLKKRFKTQKAQSNVINALWYPFLETFPNTIESASIEFFGETYTSLWLTLAHKL